MKRKTPTKEEYEKLSHEMKYYYDNNNIILICECGKPIVKVNKKYHIKTKTHKIIMSIKNNNNVADTSNILQMQA